MIHCTIGCRETKAPSDWCELCRSCRHKTSRDVPGRLEKGEIKLVLHLRKIHRAVLLPLILSLGVVNYAQTTTSTQTREPLPLAADGQTAVYLAGLTDVKPGTKGALFLSSSGVRFEKKEMHASIPVTAITSVARGDERSEKGGTAGRVIRMFSNYRGGFLIMGPAMSKKIDLLSFEYHDSAGGIHGAVFALPKGTASMLEDRLSAQITPHPLPEQVVCSADQVKPDSIELEPIESSGIEVPAEYRFLLYERLITSLQQQLPAYRFFRAGGIAASPSCMAYSLHITLTGFKKGNRTLRASTGAMGMFAGLTALSYQLELKNTSGAVVLDKTLTQSQRGDKESLNLTESIAKNIAKRVNKGIQSKDSGQNK